MCDRHNCFVLFQLSDLVRSAMVRLAVCRDDRAQWFSSTSTLFIYLIVYAIGIYLACDALMLSGSVSGVVIATIYIVAPLFLFATFVGNVILPMWCIFLKTSSEYESGSDIFASRVPTSLLRPPTI